MVDDACVRDEPGGKTLPRVGVRIGGIERRGHHSAIATSQRERPFLRGSPRGREGRTPIWNIRQPLPNRAAKLALATRRERASIHIGGAAVQAESAQKKLVLLEGKLDTAGTNVVHVRGKGEHLR